MGIIMPTVNTNRQSPDSRNRNRAIEQAGPEYGPNKAAALRNGVLPDLTKQLKEEEENQQRATGSRLLREAGTED